MQTVIYEEIIKLQPRGVFTVPKKLRKNLFEENNLAKISRVGRKLIIEPVRTISYPVRAYTDFEIDKFFDLDAKETTRLKKKGLI